MDAHLDQTLALVDLAQCFGMSIWHFSFRFQVAPMMNSDAQVTTKDSLAFAHRPFKNVEIEAGKARSHFEVTHLRAFNSAPRRVVL